MPVKARTRSSVSVYVSGGCFTRSGRRCDACNRFFRFATRLAVDLRDMQTLSRFASRMHANGFFFNCVYSPQCNYVLFIGRMNVIAGQSATPHAKTQQWAICARESVKQPAFVSRSTTPLSTRVAWCAGNKMHNMHLYRVVTLAYAKTVSQPINALLVTCVDQQVIIWYRYTTSCHHSAPKQRDHLVCTE